jgi:uncharacterized repeat protein (TIGR01451 family)
VADTLAAGEQTCQVVAQSTNVTTGRDDARSIATVTVIEPRMKLSIIGDKMRFTNTIATYTVTVENPGTETVHNVHVVATLPPNGRLVGPVSGGELWNGKVVWTIPRLEPGEKAKQPLAFQVRMGGVGIHQVAVEARADGDLSEKASFCTDVSGLADLEFEVLEQRRVVEVNGITTFAIRIKNIGSKDATKLLIRARLSKNIEPIEIRNGAGDHIQAQFNPALRQLDFPPIDRLGPCKELVMGIKVKANAKGLGTCRALLRHDDLDDNHALEDMAAFKITALRP